MLPCILYFIMYITSDLKYHHKMFAYDILLNSLRSFGCLFKWENWKTATASRASCVLFNGAVENADVVAIIWTCGTKTCPYTMRAHHRYIRLCIRVGLDVCISFHNIQCLLKLKSHATFTDVIRCVYIMKIESKRTVSKKRAFEWINECCVCRGYMCPFFMCRYLDR